MNDERLEAYKAMLKVLPREQSDAFQQMMSAHRLRPTDPSIVGVALQFLVSEQQMELISSMAIDSKATHMEFRKVLNSDEARYIVAALKQRRNLTRAFWANVAFLFVLLVSASYSVGLLVNWTNQSALHARVCTVEMRYVTRIAHDAQESGSQAIVDWIGKEPNADCSG